MKVRLSGELGVGEARAQQFGVPQWWVFRSTCRHPAGLAQLATLFPNSSVSMEPWLLLYEETEVKRSSELSKV